MGLSAADVARLGPAARAVAGRESDGERTFVALWRRVGPDYIVEDPVREYAFAHPRRWRFDFAWPYVFVAVEIDGGALGIGRPCRACGRRQMGRHNTMTGYVSDAEKTNAAAERGWLVFRLVPGQTLNEAHVRAIARIVRSRMG